VSNDDEAPRATRRPAARTAMNTARWQRTSASRDTSRSPRRWHGGP